MDTVPGELGQQRMKFDFHWREQEIGGIRQFSREEQIPFKRDARCENEKTAKNDRKRAAEDYVVITGQGAFF